MGPFGRAREDNARSFRGRVRKSHRGERRELPGHRPRIHAGSTEHADGCWALSDAQEPIFGDGQDTASALSLFGVLSEYASSAAVETSSTVQPAEDRTAQ